MTSRNRRVEKRKLMINNEPLIHPRSPGENLRTTLDKTLSLRTITSGSSHSACDTVGFGEGVHEIAILMKTEQVEISKRIFSQLRASWDDNTNPLFSHLASAYLEQRNCDTIIQDCTKIIRLQPKAWQSFFLRASALCESGNIADAMADIGQVRRLCPQKRYRRLDKLLARCTRAVENRNRAHHLKTILDEGSQRPHRPFLKGDKRISSGQVLLFVQESIQVICKILDNPHLGAAIWKEDAFDRWKKRLRLTTTNNSYTNTLQTHPRNKERDSKFDYGQVIILEKLKMVHYFLAKNKFNKDVSKYLGSLTSTFFILLAVYKHYNMELALEIIHETLILDGNNGVSMNAFLRVQPLHIVIEAFQDSHGSSSAIASMLLDVIATHKAQKVLTVLIEEDLVPLLARKISLGSAREHACCVGLLFKVSLDPRLTRQLKHFPSTTLYEICDGLKRACRGSQPVTRVLGVKIIEMILKFDEWVHAGDWGLPSAHPSRIHIATMLNDDGAIMTLRELFIKSGVYREVVLLLARESESAPKKAEISSSIWEEDVELICQEIVSNVTNFNEAHECTLRDFNLLSGYAQIVMLNCMRVIDLIGPSKSCFEILDEAKIWGLLISLLPAFPQSLAIISINILATFCQRSKTVANRIANLWPANSSRVLLEFASSTRESGALQPHQASMVVLASLAIATCKSFLTNIQKPTMLTILIDFLHNEKSTTIALTATCTCLTKAMSSSRICVEYAEIKASMLGTRLLQLWCEYRSESLLKYQVENLMVVLMSKSDVLQRTFLFLMQKHGSLSPISRSSTTRTHAVSSSYERDYLQSNLNFQDGETYRVVERCAAFSQNRKIFEEFCECLSSIVQPSAKLVDLCSWIGLLSIQVAKHFKDIHCYSINRKRSCMEHTRRLAKQEAVQNLTTILCNRFDKLPHTLPSNLDVAVLCFSLDVLIHDLGHLFSVIISKLHQHGKLVLIDDKERLISEARLQATIHGWNVLAHSSMEEKYFILVLQRSCEA